MTEYRSQTGFAAFFVAVDCKSWGQILYTFELIMSGILVKEKHHPQPEV
jgi:hypothetical protein